MTKTLDLNILLHLSVCKHINVPQPTTMRRQTYGMNIVEVQAEMAMAVGFFWSGSRDCCIM
jgi:hypothetical protein